MKLGWNRKAEVKADRWVEKKGTLAWTPLQQVPGSDLWVDQIRRSVLGLVDRLES